jgi:hypothetical protein
VKRNTSFFFRQRKLLCLYSEAEIWKRGEGEYIGDRILNFRQ